MFFLADFNLLIDRGRGLQKKSEILSLQQSSGFSFAGQYLCHVCINMYANVDIYNLMLDCKFR